LELRDGGVAGSLSGIGVFGFSRPAYPGYRPLSGHTSGFEPGCVKKRSILGFPFGFAPGDLMKRFVESVDRGQAALFPECLEDWIGEDNPVRVIEVFVDGLDLAELGFDRVRPQATGRPIIPRFC